LSGPARLVRGRILTFKDDPAATGVAAHAYVEDGAVLMKNGHIEAAGGTISRVPKDAV
jgi:guanine deaminase